MEEFKQIYGKLNKAQKQAVDAIEGPVLVIAGPGTGKTQLLTTRIANILMKTDSRPENILCLTFTDSAAHTMRERLTSIIGSDAYAVTISTYHSFGSDIIRRYNEYFDDQPNLRPIDELGTDQTLRAIVQALPYSNPLRMAEAYIRDLKSTISELKRALLKPEDLLEIAESNERFIVFANQAIGQTIADVPRISAKSVGQFQKLAEQTSSYQQSAIGQTLNLAELWQNELDQALEDFTSTNKTSQLTNWKKHWLAKDISGQTIIDGARSNQKLIALAEVYRKYQQQLEARNLYDYDDMILRAINGLETNPDLRYTLQEKYLYILLDEFQDTNSAQLKLVELLTDSPVHEGSPNVLAVGDDDQAIYAFQGANYSHMLSFQHQYKNVLVVPLTENYRSTGDILKTAGGISEQISERLHHYTPGIDKQITAANSTLPKGIVERLEFKTDISQYAWVTKQIQQLIRQGTKPKEIAVIAPKHRLIEPLVSYLHQAGLAVQYELSENILDEPIVISLTQMSQLVLALRRADSNTANQLWPEVLSYDFWQLPTELIWQLSWSANDAHDNYAWTKQLLNDQATRPIALFFIRLSQVIGSETLETILDYLVGNQSIEIIGDEIGSYQSPLYNYYFGTSNSQQIEYDFWRLLASLTILREHLNNYKNEDLMPLMLGDFIEFVLAHRAANIRINNTNPYQDSVDAIQLMSAHKAKGKEFEAVFVLACLDDVWGEKSSSKSSSISLPANLRYTRHAGGDTDERLRLLYVAMTRAKTNLYLTSYTNKFDGKLTNRLSYLQEQVTDSQTISPLLPENNQLVKTIDLDAPAIPAMNANWQQRHTGKATIKLKPLLSRRLENYQLSPTDLTSFTNLEYGGPTDFFLHRILKFPSATTPEIQYGNAVHETLEWINNVYQKTNANKNVDELLAYFEQKLRSKRLSQEHTDRLIERGRLSLRAYYEQRSNQFSISSLSEYNFRGEAVFAEKAHLTGKIDKLLIDEDNKTVSIVDYKTGRSHSRWDRETRLHRYKQQLYFYKILVEGSRRFAGYTVKQCSLEFTDPDETGKIQELVLDFNQQEFDDIKKLIVSIWSHVTELSFPLTDNYAPSLKGIQSFETDLIDNKI